MENENQLRILYLYQILLKYSDADHPLSTHQLMKLMEDEHQIKVHRTRIPEYVQALNSCGLEVMIESCSREKVYYLNDRPFEISEIKLLIDAVESSRFISEKESRGLTEKLIGLASQGEAEKLKRNIYTAGKVKTDNQKIFYIIDVINEAINTGHRISFQYTEYNVTKRLVMRNNGKPYIFSPWSMIWNGDYYYVLGYNHNRDHLATFRIDRIRSTPVILEDEAEPMPKNFKISEYASGVFRMYDTDEAVTVTLRCENDLMKHIIDQFGIKVDTTPVDKDHFDAKVEVCASPTFYSWVFQWDDKMQIMDPPEVQEEYGRMLARASERNSHSKTDSGDTNLVCS